MRPVLFSAGSGSSTQQNQNLALFRIYVGYRALLSLVLLIMLFSPNVTRLVGELHPKLYTAVALLYLATSIPLMGTLSSHLLHRQNSLFLVFAVDIAAIILMSHSSGGISSGLPVLLVITAAASAVLIESRTLATTVAALSVIAVLSDAALLTLRGGQALGTMFPAGLLGMLIFAVSLSVQAFAQRLGRVEELARSRASDLYNLQQLNEQIVQHMRTGILLLDASGTVQVLNKAANGLLAPAGAQALERGRPLSEYHPRLEQLLAQWRSGPGYRAQPFPVRDGAPNLIANFVELPDGDTLVFLEDYTPVTRHAQALKLNSLGRLTASIAHEVRNPLGAISHAAQLLRESPDLAEGDRRMADIIVNHCDRVNQIVESVMQISRKEPPKPQTLELAEWLEEFVGAYLRTLQRPAEVGIHCDYRDLRVEFDPENLERVLGNLLDNALRHSKLTTERETARIRVGADFGSNQVFVDIIDDGSGVPETDRGKLFEPFFTTVEEGSGMGLYLCQELCELNGAELHYQPTPKGESCFRISMSLGTP